MKAIKKVIKKYNNGGKSSKKEPRVNVSLNNLTTSETTTKKNKRSRFNK